MALHNVCLIFLCLYLFAFLLGYASAHMSRSKDNSGVGVLLFCDVCFKDETQVPGLEAGAFTNPTISLTPAVLMGLFLSTHRRHTTESDGLWASAVGLHFI